MEILKEKLEKQINNQTNELTISNITNSKFDILKVFTIFSILFIIVLTIIFSIITIMNANNKNIINGIYVKNLNISGLTKEQAKQKISEYINSSIPEEIKLVCQDFETSISTSQLEIKFDADEAVEIAYKFGRTGNIFENNYTILEALFSKIFINPAFSINKEQLINSLKDISNKLPNKLIDSNYYIEDNNLILTSGSEGYSIKIEECANYIIDNINNLTILDNPLQLILEKQYPSKINIEKIYNELHKNPIDAYYTQNPYKIHPSENGLDFAISIDEAKNLLNEEKEQYSIPLKVLYPNVTTNMIGTEAFPDLLSEFSTNYDASNRNRTTNLILASNKINGTVLMPGDTFSYNKVVGERTIAAGYKEAPIYVNGKVEDGLGGGICQITTTLYNAALYANLDIIERSNHQFIPSYSKASLDATVVYGAIDFKFKNNRDYPIKIICFVSNGIANFKIFGIKTENDYEVQLSSKITKTTSSYIYSEAYKTLKKNGNVINTKILSKDTYKRH